MCGEKIYSVRDNIAEQGSPPHVRGKDVLHCNSLT